MLSASVKLFPDFLHSKVMKQASDSIPCAKNEQCPVHSPTQIVPSQTLHAWGAFFYNQGQLTTPAMANTYHQYDKRYACQCDKYWHSSGWLQNKLRLRVCLMQLHMHLHWPRLDTCKQGARICNEDKQCFCIARAYVQWSPGMQSSRQLSL